ncbi:MAG: tetratricopeptide repeat protein [Mangrovibacterium sp.]
MSQEQEDFSEDDEQIAEAVARFKQAEEEGVTPYFDVFEYEGIIDYFMEEAEVDLACRALSCALEVHPNSFEIKLKNVQIQLFNGEALKALELLEKLENIERENVDLNLAKGTAYIQLGMLEKAIELYHFANEQSGEIDSDLAYDIALSLQQAEDYERAISFLQAAYEESENVSLMYELGYCYSRIGEVEKGTKCYEDFLRDEPLNAAVWYNLGINYNQLGEFQKAVEAYDYAIALQEDLDQALFNKGNVLANVQHYAEAIESYQEYLQLTPDSEEGHMYLADCFLATNQFKEACIHYKEAYDLNHSNIDALHHIAVSLMSDGRFESALKIMDEVLLQESNNPLFLTTFGNINYELDDYAKATEAYKKALAIDEHCMVAWGALADIAAHKESLIQALAIIETGMIKNPEDLYLTIKKVVILVEMDLELEVMDVLKDALKRDDSEAFCQLLQSQVEEETENKLAQKVIKLIIKN